MATMKERVTQTRITGATLRKESVELGGTKSISMSACVIPMDSLPEDMVEKITEGE